MERHIEISLTLLRSAEITLPRRRACRVAERTTQRLEQDYLHMFKRFRGYLRDGIAAGVIRDCHTTSTARALLTALDWSFYWLYEMPESDAKQASRVIRTLFSNGLVPRNSDFTLGEVRPKTNVTASQWLQSRGTKSYEAGSILARRHGTLQPKRI